MTALTQLPPELLGLIITNVAREGLKSLRLTNRALSAIATTQLFSHMHISPNSSSFDRAHSVSQHKNLNQYIKSLTYHFGKLAEVYAGFEAYKREYSATRRTSASHDPYEITPQILWGYNCWLEEIEAQQNFDLRCEADGLIDLCSQLPNLESIATILDEANPFGDQDDYIGNRTGMATTDDDGLSRFPCLFAATVTKPLQRISARSIQWHDLGFIEEGSDQQITASHACLSRLKSLELAIYRRQTYFENEDSFATNTINYLHHVTLLDTLLSHTTHLTTLHLDFDELPYESDPEISLPISTAIFKHHWPHLRDLKLEALCVHETDLVTFLSAHRTTLTRLCIGDIELVSTINDDDDNNNNNNNDHDNPPSILNLFTTLHAILSLHTCRITGNFTNRINQAWYVDTEHNEPGCLRDQLEKYICGASPHRSDKMTSDDVNGGDLGPGELLELWIHKVNGEYEAFQDGSWQWAPELLPD